MWKFIIDMVKFDIIYSIYRKFKFLILGIAVIFGLSHWLGVDLTPAKDKIISGIENIDVKKTANSIDKTFELVNELGNKDKGKTYLVTSVYDGDTITVKNSNKTLKIRLYGIDAPELKQKDGTFSRKVLYDKVYQKNVTVKVMNKDRYGRSVAKIYLKDEYINLYLLEKGTAFWYENYARDDNELARAYEKARKNRVGIFKNQNIQTPSEYRKSQKR